MSVKLLKKFPLILLMMNFIACSFLTPAAATPSVDEIEKEEQVVYSFFAGGNGVMTVILQETSTGISQDPPESDVEYIKSSLPGISKETINSYLARNAQPSQLPPDMQLGVDYSLITADDLSRITSQPNWSDVLSEEYKGAQGYIIFSRVGFNNTLDQAILYVGNVAGPMMGAGYYYLMEKKNGEWVIKEQVMSWIS